jgi:hypothetical protein
MIRKICGVCGEAKIKYCFKIRTQTEEVASSEQRNKIVLAILRRYTVEIEQI